MSSDETLPSPLMNSSAKVINFNNNTYIDLIKKADLLDNLDEKYLPTLHDSFVDKKMILASKDNKHFTPINLTREEIRNIELIRNRVIQKIKLVDIWNYYLPFD